jgi:hypothetical protein
MTIPGKRTVLCVMVLDNSNSRKTNCGALHFVRAYRLKDQELSGHVNLAK